MDSQETEPTGQDRPDKPSIGRFFRGLRGVVQRNPILSRAGLVLLFLLGWFAETVLDTVYNRFFPDAEQLRAQVLRQKIDEKTDTIATQLAAMEASLAKAGSDGAQAEAFVASAEAVMQELRSLRPEISQFAEDADRFTAQLASAKAAELSSTGQSAQADFTIPNGSGMTLCPQRFTMGFNNVSHDETVVVRLSRNGDETDNRISPGQSARLDSGNSAVTVSYLGESTDDSKHRFNFSCLSL